MGAPQVQPSSKQHRAIRHAICKSDIVDLRARGESRVTDNSRVSAEVPDTLSLFFPRIS